MTNTIREERDQLFIDQWDGKTPKRVPIIQPLDLACALEQKGYSLTKEQYSPEKSVEALDYVSSKLDTDVLPLSMPSNPIYLRVMGSHKMKMGSDGYIQHANISVMHDDEYKEYTKDIVYFNATKAVDRLYDKITLTGTKDVDPLVNATTLLKGQLAQQYWNDVYLKGKQEVVDKYNFSTWDYMAGIGLAPFDTLADFNRSFTEVLNDIRRRPSEVLEAVDALTDFEKLRIANAPTVKGARIFYALHMPSFMRTKDVEKFWWPSFMEVIKENIRLGSGIYIFCEDDYTRFLDLLNELPEGALLRFEKTDVNEAVKKLDKKFVTTGFFPMDVYRSYGIDEAIDETKRFLDIVAPGGRYRFMADKSPLRGSDIQMGVIQAVIKTIKEYGVY